ncbi:MAG: hypothetical protein GWN00_37000, partial [Aliifodinibius sp.]|nr:hypothetical protein [candidate division Zixibacteria bacterium]NIT61602.1 hypothetical protein [Fodinibius sp.]NIW50113.1 hypothetical protein [Gammaproteobacteria bacterium]NIS49007.1 hypothetical protein [candidate division Zixibacteria bacterium]NIU17089.1 hypothetical protein [candidate division Zixibacteria bacterium]
IWNNTSTIKLRQRDFAPLAPTNLSRSIADPYGDRHPRIDWDANAEADLDEYEVWKKKGSGTWNLLATTSQTYYVDNSETGVSLYPYSNNVEIDYKLKAVDLQNNKSGYSETVTFNQRGGGFDKPGQDDPLLANNGAIPDQYQLAQNYPNPFNPATTIS